MTAQPIEPRGVDPRDPELILARLPERYRAMFLAEYQAAAEAAAHEVWRYKQLQELLHDMGGTHTLEIRPFGDGRVTVDAFVVLP